MNSNLLFFCGLTLFFCSCKKDNSTSEPGAANKLTKVVSTDGTYTTNTLFSYDAAGRLSGFRETETGGGSTYETGVRIVRKSDGMIEKIVSKVSDMADSITANVASTGKQYTGAQWTENYGSYSITRDVAFTNDGQGRPASATTTETYSGDTPEPDERYDFTYQNNSLATLKVYRIGSSASDPFLDYSFEYDQKTNPLVMGTEGSLLDLVLGTPFFLYNSANNVFKMTVTQEGPSGLVTVFTLAYKYNNQNLPVSATSTITGSSSGTQSLTYTYE